MLFVGIDDTDTLESRGTGRLARQIASALAGDYQVLGVVRHQLLVDPRVPYTRNNSAAAILLDGRGPVEVTDLVERIRALMIADHQPGSDPGLCVAQVVPDAVTRFGLRAKRELVSQAEARTLAATHGISLLGLGGDESGVIGALAAVGLAASGEDGRYVELGSLREMEGLLPVSVLLAAGIAGVQTAEGQPVQEGLVQVDNLRPARRGGRAIAVVEWADGHWLPLKLD